MDARGVEVDQVVAASRKLGRAEARALIEGASRVIVAKGRKVTEFPGGRATKEAVGALLGPTGNLRAPTVRVGTTILVGFDQESFEATLPRLTTPERRQPR